MHTVFLFLKEIDELGDRFAAFQENTVVEKRHMAETMDDEWGALLM